MLEVANALHGFVPARIGEQIQGSELKPCSVGPCLSQRGLDLAALGQVPNRTPNAVAGIEQFEGDMAPQKSGNSGEQNKVGHRPLLAIERNV